MIRQKLSLVVITYFQVAYCILLQKGGTNNVACSKQNSTDEQLRHCALNDGVGQLLEGRNDEYGWGSRTEAEAIIALHLANDAWFSRNDPSTYISVKQMNLDLLSAISNDVGLTNEAWGHGKLAHYVLGLTATCQNPSNFYGHNLTDKLQNHLVVSTQHFQHNKFAYALVILALCNANASVDAAYVNDISTNPGVYTFGVDEAAMVYLAFQCINDPKYSIQSKAALEYIRHNEDDKGLYGNEYSTALAVQALFASKDKTLQEKADPGILFLIDSIDRTKNPANHLLLSVLPAIAKKSYIDVGTTPCIAKNIVTTTPSTKMFTIKITVINKITANYQNVWFASLREGQSLYDALKNLQKADSSFSFTSTTSTFGQSIRSVAGMVAITADRQYWQMLDSNDQSLPKASDHFFPTEGSSFTFKLTTW